MSKYLIYLFNPINLAGFFLSINLTLATPPPAFGAITAVTLTFGNDISDQVKARVSELIRLVPLRLSAPTNAGDSESLVLAFGSSPLARSVIPDSDLAALGPEGFIVRSAPRGRTIILAARGNPAKGTMVHGNIGAHFGAYAMLEELGFGFLRPLAPTPPTALNLTTAPLNRKEQPRWRIRAMHLHTQHPLELTDVLQGWGKTGPADEAGFIALVPEWERYVEWLIANRQNRVEWALLWAQSWQEFADSPVRQERLRQLVGIGHAYGVNVGVDVPLTLAQQHAYRLVRTTGTLATELSEIHTSVDWLMAAGFDFLGTETGTSEFTHPAAARTLAWMNEFAVYTSQTYAKPVYVKVHCSTGQTADGYLDPKTGTPINFNMLPHFADARLGVLPHTVEFYGLDDPAPTYGNKDFNYMRNFLRQEVGSREVVYYPESAYWVGYDIDVPLFLPIYGERRVHDLRLLAGDEDAGLMGVGVHAGKHMDGQLDFSSGWEWGYWLNDVVTARAAWDPAQSAPSDRAAFIAVTQSALKVFGAAAPAVSAWLADVTAAENALLIHGEVNRVAPDSVIRKNGQAYLEGFDTWADVGELLAQTPAGQASETRPARLGLVDGRTPWLRAKGPSYTTQVAPLLNAMEQTFAALLAQGEALAPHVPPAASSLFADLLAAARMTALRAAQQHGLYDYALGDLTPEQKLARLGTARQALDQAEAVVATRELAYALPAADRERIAGWRSGPTAYQFGYLWTVRSLYYWWRDEGKAVDAPRSPCYLNIIDPVDVSVGKEQLVMVAHWATRSLPTSKTGTCLAPPAQPWIFPIVGLRSRP